MAVAAIEYLLCDVFGERPFTGNPLAVFFGADGLSDRQMLALAREFGWSEITLVVPARLREAACRVRIWTPSGEYPFAGHPTIGTTVVLGVRGMLPPEGRAVLELGIGPIAVEVLDLQASGGWARMQQQRPAFGGPFEGRTALAAAFGLDPDDLNPDLPAQTVSTGLPFLLVPLRHPDILARVRPDPLTLPALLAQLGARRPYCFALPGGGAPVRARMLDTDREDAATGSAAGCLASYLVHHGVLSPGAVEIAQGEEMGRPSRLHATIEGGAGAVASVRVGGQVHIWASGQLLALPPD